MTGVATYTRTDLARKTREILDLVLRGHPALIESYGKKHAILLDLVDYRLLQSLVGVLLGRSEEDESLGALLQRYLKEEVSLGKVAETLGVSRFELMERFDRLGLPLNTGPVDLEDARREVEAVRGK